MYAYELSGPSLDTFQSVSLPDPKPRRGEALVWLRAASFNFIDVAVANGAYPGAKFPLIPLAERAPPRMPRPCAA
jgi:NADPH:quinone reductase-like Zn-dependent oxidoreductase